MMNALNKVREWFAEYDDEITWFLIGSLNADGLSSIVRKDTMYGLFMLFISCLMWYLYMKELKGRK